jgi:hypothetical protein
VLPSTSPSVAHQRQRRDAFAAEGVPPGLDLDLKRAVVRPISRRLAAQVILKYEYLGTMAKTNRHYGLFFGNACAGVACVVIGGGTAGIETHKQFGIAAGALAVLARGACVHWAPPGANSKLVAWTAKLVAREGVARVLLAFADPEAGEIGTIYQACNWTYLGARAGSPDLRAPNGRIYNRKLIHSLRNQRGTLDSVTFGEQRDALLRAGWRFAQLPPKHRYAYVLDRTDLALRARLDRLALPYPKRAGRLASEATSPHDDEDGATPIPALR